MSTSLRNKMRARGLDRRRQSGDFASLVTAVQDADAPNEGVLNFRQVLDCGDGVCGVAAFGFAMSADLPKHAATVHKPKR